jgi:putative glutamine amidotransferase
MRQKILLSLPYNSGENYIKAFSECGFSVCGGYLSKDTNCDGLVLCGGGDIAPYYYGEEDNGSDPPDVKRDECEMYLFEKYYNAKKPIFGICRGMQIINVALGGNLYQDLPFSGTHRYENGDKIHEVINMKGSFFYEIYGEKMIVNSAHHQGCKNIAKGLCMIQRHKDLSAEAFSGEKILAVQWHPERMWKRGGFPDVYPVFQYFKDMF